MKNLLEHVEHSIRERKLILPGARILVAVSGGLDSMVLLQLLYNLSQSLNWKLCVAHYNHQLRGKASDADERFVSQMASRLQLVIQVGRGDVKAFATKKAVSVEMAARELRHAFLARAARRLRCSVVALAHHADDQVELFLLRLLRGAGPEGLTGLKWQSTSPADKTVQTVRPLLDVTKLALGQFADIRRIRYREDATNASVDILRNRVRHELLPFLRRRFQPAVDRSILRLTDILRADSEMVDRAARAWLELQPAKRRFAEQPAGLQRRVIQLQLRERGIDHDFDLIDLLRRSPAQSVTVSPGLYLRCDEVGCVSCVDVKPRGFRQGRARGSLVGRSGLLVFDGMEIRWRKAGLSRAAFGRSVRGREVFDADRVGAHIVLRHWRAGDRFQPIGMQAAVKLQDWFTNRKIPGEQRRNLIVAMTTGGEIFWIEGERIGEGFKLTGQTRHQLIWSWKRSQTT